MKIRFSLGYTLTSSIGLYFVNDKGKEKSEIHSLYWRIYILAFAVPSLLRIILMTFVINFETPYHYILTKRGKD